MSKDFKTRTFPKPSKQALTHESTMSDSMMKFSTDEVRQIWKQSCTRRPTSLMSPPALPPVPRFSLPKPPTSSTACHISDRSKAFPSYTSTNIPSRASSSPTLSTRSNAKSTKTVKIELSNESIENYIADNPEKRFLALIVSVHGPPKVKRLGENERRRVTCYRAQFRNGTEIWLPVGYLRQDPMISAAIDMDNVKRRAEIARSQSIVYSKTRTDLVSPTPVVTRTSARQSHGESSLHQPPVESAAVHKSTESGPKKGSNVLGFLRQERARQNGNGEDVLRSWGRDCDEIMKKLETLEPVKLNRDITTLE